MRLVHEERKMVMELEELVKMRRLEKSKRKAVKGMEAPKKGVNWPNKAGS